MATVISNNVLVNGLRTEFADTYEAIRNRQADSRLGQIMDLSIGATNRNHDFAYFESSPHISYWERGETIPTDAMSSVQFNVPIYEWARRVPWSKHDRKDDQTDSLMTMVRQCASSAALLPERMLFDLLTGSASTMPAVPLAPDGVAMFNATDGAGGARFGESGGNIVAGDGVTTTAQIQTNFYESIVRWKSFQDGKGQPLLGDDVLEQGFLIIHPVEITQKMEEAFEQTRQVGTSGSTPSNVVQEANRTVELWGTNRLTDVDDWYIFLKGAPKKPTFFLDREGVQEFSSLEGDNNSDLTRSTGEEYIQWETRAGSGIALPFGAIQITN